ncbi:MAG: EFR1 family ferrodoxin [Candidatus Lokiarchaeota archaeon]|nr:EFR1 family ferrodoxin [Candidatus Lokiarchaeota archaeon]
MATEIYYFSGTGNSLYVARELKKRIPDLRLIPIVALLNERTKERNKSIKSIAETIGFVFPCHGLTIPIPVKKFLKYLDLTSSEYLFAIATRGGSIFHGFSAIDKILNKQGKKLDASIVINMGMNDPKLKSFSVPTSEDLKEIELRVQEKLDIIQNCIINHKSYHDSTSGVTFSHFSPFNYILERLVPFTVHHVAPKVKKYFYADSKCTGCGTCEKVCLSRKITMANERPIWQNNIECYMCYTCLNYCPAQSIQIYSKFYMKSFTEEKGRYPHPYAQVKDIIIQKSNPSTP